MSSGVSKAIIDSLSSFEIISILILKKQIKQMQNTLEINDLKNHFKTILFAAVVVLNAIK